MLMVTRDGLPTVADGHHRPAHPWHSEPGAPLPWMSPAMELLWGWGVLRGAGAAGRSQASS